MKKEKVIDYEVEDSKPVESEGSIGGNAEAEEDNNNAVWAIVAITVIALVLAIVLAFI